MPFYIYPQAKSWVSFEDTVITFLDWMVDAHELERNKQDNKKTFYMRSVYVSENFFRYQNDTIANMMFDTKARKSDYDRINAANWRGNFKFYLSMTGLHALSLMYLTYFFRYRKVTFVPSLLIGTAYYFYFTKTNQIGYKFFVDKAVISEARRLGYERQVQPVGHFRPRGLNYN
mmetsp:Transcript_35044/g.26152  ORF Transcript_35044/g.26152 Transcript_35044/m.26152 type:complete len:174 (+) Transcript_35044:120-641(+)